MTRPEDRVLKVIFLPGALPVAMPVSVTRPEDRVLKDNQAIASTTQGGARFP